MSGKRLSSDQTPGASLAPFPGLLTGDLISSEAQTSKNERVETRLQAGQKLVPVCQRVAKKNYNILVERELHRKMIYSAGRKNTKKFNCVLSHPKRPHQDDPATSLRLCGGSNIAMRSTLYFCVYQSSVSPEKGSSSRNLIWFGH